MSYILNALRKSEKERQSLQPETATDRILVQGFERSGGAFNWKILFIVSNLLILLALITAVVIWSSQKPEPAVASAAPEPFSKPSAAKVEQKSPKQAPSEIAPQTKPSVKAPVLPSPTLAELAAATKPVENPMPIKAPVQKESTQIRASERPVSDKTRPVSVKKIESSVVQAKKPLFDSSAETAAAEEKKLESAAVQPDKIPFLDEMPDEFRHSMPRMTINVFVFTPEPSERFVMINMVKYKVGQKTYDGIEIKDIRKQSLVAGYNGRTFQIERP
ncbi:MAG: general secretion pathway protein GspB [Gammaproteobacteria bacterium]